VAGLDPQLAARRTGFGLQCATRPATAAGSAVIDGGALFLVLYGAGWILVS